MKVTIDDKQYEVKEVKGVITILYKLDEQGNRIEERNTQYQKVFSIGIVQTKKIQNQLN